MRSLLTVLVVAFHCIPVFSQNDNVGAGHSLRFDGINDYVDLGNAYDNLTYPFTVSAWVYMPPSPSGGPILVTQDNDALYNGFWFYVTPTVLYLEYGDGMGGDNPAFRSGKAVNMTDMSGRWNHVCAVVKGTKNIDLYINGSKPAGAYQTGGSNFPMVSNYPGAPASIGHFLSNGIHYYFKGDMDDVRIFNRELSETEIQNQMCRKLTGNETGLIGYWSMDETTGTAVNDKSSNHFNGQLKNSPACIFSGAPIGDQSKFLYTTSWAGKSLYMNDQDDSIAVTNIQGDPSGVHIYEVQDLPSQQNGLDPSSISQPYFGVFIAGMDNDNQFDARYYYDGGDLCAVFKRNDNSIPDWLTSDDLLANQFQRTELIRSSDGQPPQSFSLGVDEEWCELKTKTLKPFTDPSGYAFTWQDGSKQSTFEAEDYGIYWVIVENGCGSVRDSVTFSKSDVELVIPNVITPNGDALNQFFKIDERLEGPVFLEIFNRWGTQVFHSDAYTNTWDGSGLSSGVYFYRIIGGCIGEKMGSISILR